MAITARDIQEQGFEHSRKGYDVEEVDIFLERVANEVDALIRQNQELRARLKQAQSQGGKSSSAPIATGGMTDAKQRQYEARIKELESRVAEKGADATAVGAALVTAQKSAEEIKEQARKEGEKIYHEAEDKAREIVRDALADKQQTLGELEHLRDSRERFRSDYQAMLKKFQLEADKTFSAEMVSAVSKAANDALDKNAVAAPVAQAATAIGSEETVVDAGVSADAGRTGTLADFGDTDDDFDIEDID